MILESLDYPRSLLVIARIVKIGDAQNMDAMKSAGCNVCHTRDSSEPLKVCLWPRSPAESRSRHCAARPVRPRSRRR
jgi:hypothetical protein